MCICQSQSPNSKLIQPLWKIVWRFLKKLEIELPCEPAIQVLGIYPEKTIIQKDTWTPMFTAALFTIARTWKQPKCPSTEEWIKKMWYIYTMEYYSAIKWNEIGWFVEASGLGSIWISGDSGTRGEDMETPFPGSSWTSSIWLFLSYILL